MVLVWYPTPEHRSITLPGVGNVDFKTEVRDVEHPRIEYNPTGHFLVIRASRTQSVTDILWERRNWILEQRNRVEELIARLDDHPSNYRQALLFEGSRFEIKRSHGKYCFSVDDNTIFVRTPDSEEHISHLASEIRERLRTRVTNLVHRYVEVFEAPTPEIHIRNQKTKWASSSSNGITSFNIRSAGLPETQLEYLVAHEIVHQNIPNHGPGFWRELKSIIANPKERQQDLESYWHLINRIGIWQGIVLSL